MTPSPIEKSNVVINSPKNESASHVAVAEEAEDYDEDSEKEEKEPIIVVKLVKSAVNFVFDFLETIVVALSVFVVIYLFIIQPHEVKGSSMEPSFHNNEYIITDKISYRFGIPKRGDVVIFKAPVNPDVDYIKRIIGLPGDRVEIAGGIVKVNGSVIEEKYLASDTPLFPGGYMQEGVEITVPEGQYFVMGDNRPHSSDSREFGPVPKKLFIGRAVFRYWPINEIGVLPHFTYQIGN